MVHNCSHDKLHCITTGASTLLRQRQQGPGQCWKTGSQFGATVKLKLSGMVLIACKADSMC